MHRPLLRLLRRRQLHPPLSSPLSSFSPYPPPTRPPARHPPASLRGAHPSPAISASPLSDELSSLTREDSVSLLSSHWISSFRSPETTAASSLSPLLRSLPLWILAYQKVAADDTGSYVPKHSIPNSALEDLLCLRNAVLDGRFRFGSRLEFFIRSPRDKTDLESLSKRKIKALLTTAQPSPFQDRIVQEVLLMILEPIYEARFSQKSFAFRPGRTAHTVIRVIRRSFAGKTLLFFI